MQAPTTKAHNLQPCRLLKTNFRQHAKLRNKEKTGFLQVLFSMVGAYRKNNPAHRKT